MNKKLMFGLLGLFCIGMVAATIGYYAVFSTTISVQESITLSELCEDKFDAFDGDTVVGDECIVTNHAPSERVLNFSNDAPIGIGVTYLRQMNYAYSETWNANGNVLVEVEDTDDGWLQWTYTATTPATSGRLKMTVEINNPTGFGITTFDDGSHDGWYYYDENGIVRISDYDGTNKISGYDWVETSVNTDSMTVRINKAELPNTFMWQGFANFHLAANWIELDQSGSPWVPTAEATIQEELTNPFTLSGVSELVIVPVYEIAPGVNDTVYTITTTIA